jgi:hypothetical protein
MDLTGLVSWIPVVVFFGIILWVQRRALRTQLAAQREVLDRQKESLAVQRESVELQRESIRLLGVIASKLDRN